MGHSREDKRTLNLPSTIFLYHGYLGFPVGSETSQCFLPTSLAKGKCPKLYNPSSVLWGGTLEPSALSWGLFYVNLFWSRLGMRELGYEVLPQMELPSAWRLPSLESEQGQGLCQASSQGSEMPSPMSLILLSVGATMRIQSTSGVYSLIGWANRKNHTQLKVNSEIRQESHLTDREFPSHF